MPPLALISLSMPPTRTWSEVSLNVMAVCWYLFSYVFTASFIRMSCTSNYSHSFFVHLFKITFAHPSSEAEQINWGPLLAGWTAFTMSEWDLSKFKNLHFRKTKRTWISSDKRQFPCPRRGRSCPWRHWRWCSRPCWSWCPSQRPSDPWSPRNSRNPRTRSTGKSENKK